MFIKYNKATVRHNLNWQELLLSQPLGVRIISSLTKAVSQSIKNLTNVNVKSIPLKILLP